MSNASTIGALRVALGLDSADFEGGLNKAQRHLRKVGQDMQKTGASIATAGAAATATITTAFAAMTFHLLNGSQEAAAAAGQVNAALKSMGDVSGKTFPELQKTAEALRNLSGVDDDLILSKVTANLLTFGNVAGAVFDRAQLSILNVSARMKTDLMSSTMMVGKALNDPIKGLAALRRVGIQFTDAQEKMIKSMVSANDLAGAQGIMLSELERQFGGAAEAAGNADVWKPLKTALMELEGAFEPLIRNVMAPLIQRVADLTRSFAALSPATQQMVLVGGAIAAAAGPALIAIGSVVTAVGALTAALGSGGAIAGIAAALAPLAPFILPIAGAVAAVGAAFLLFKDDVTPVLRDLWGEAQKSLGPAFLGLFEAVKGAVTSFASLMKQMVQSEAGQALIQFSLVINKVLGSTLIQLLTTAVRLVTTAVNAIGDGFKVLSALLRGDFAGAWEAYREGTARALEGLKTAFGDLGRFAVDTIRRMVEGVTTWLHGKLFDVLRSVIDKVKGVSDAFFRLYDAVVGNSYIPDMVVEIGQWMARLDDEMVRPAQKAANATAEAFEAVRARANAAMQELLTDQERAFQDHQRRVKAFEQSIAQGGEDAAVHRIGLARENAGWDARDLKLPEVPDLTPVGDLPGIQALGDTVERMNRVIEESRERFADAFSRGLESAVRGDWAGLLESTLGNIMRNAFQSMGRSLFNSLGGNKPGGIDLSSIGNALSGLFKGFPKFQHGGSILPGGPGGIDSQFVGLWKSPDERVDIYTPGADRGGGRATTMVFDFTGAVVTEDLLRQVNTKVAAGEARVRAAVPGMAVAAVADAQERRFG